VPEACEAGDLMRKHQEIVHTGGVSPQRRATAFIKGYRYLR
jgi:hypothetical protein